jgi:hypothetical protein
MRIASARIYNSGVSVAGMSLSASAIARSVRGRQVELVKTFSRLELVLVVALGLFMLFLAVNGFLAPGPAARGFGIPIVDSADLFYLRVKADRDVTIGAVLLLLAALRERRALGALVAVSTVAPLCDLALSLADARGRAGYALPVHGSAAVYCAVLALLLLRRRD